MKQKKYTKRALCMSVLSLLLCCSMLVGTTFAWFTDSVTSGRNKITAGNLDVELYHTNAHVKTETKVDGDTKLFQNPDGTEIKWEPGVITYENFTVKNEGTLALKYELALNVFVKNATTPDGHSLDEVIKVAFLEGPFDGDRTKAQGLDYGKLTDMTKSGEIMPKGDAKQFAVVLYWEPGDDDNLYNLKNGLTTDNGEELSIELGVSLTAAQYTYESDSFDDQYDADAPMPILNDTALAAAVAEADEGDVLLLAEGNFSGKSLSGIKNGVELKGAVDASGKPATHIQVEDGVLRFNKDNTVSNIVFSGDGELAIFGNRKNTEEAAFTIENCTFETESSDPSDDIICFMGSGKIKGCTFSSKGCRGIGWSYAQGEVIIEDCTFDMHDYIAVHFDGVDGGSVSILNCNVAGSITIGGGVENVTIKDSEIDSLLDVYCGAWSSSGNTYKGQSNVYFEDNGLSFTSTGDDFTQCTAYASGEIFSFSEDVTDHDSVEILVDGVRPVDLIKG